MQIDQKDLHIDSDLTNLTGIRLARVNKIEHMLVRGGRGISHLTFQQHRRNPKECTTATLVTLTHLPELPEGRLKVR